ncbi:transposable element Tcb2 transposase [Trichonephila clavipes]|nr:transposable element Tcb2 transposase [Trichonephila clavipes]
MLVRIQQELFKTSYVIFRLFHRPARSPDFSPVEHVWDQLKHQMPSCHSVHDLELAVQDLWAHLPQDNIGDQTSLHILNLLDRIYSNNHVHFQWVPSHVGIDGNEKADFLARNAAEVEVSSIGYLTFSELSSLNIEFHPLGRTPGHPWYFGRNPGSLLKLMPSKYQTAFSRFLSGHMKVLTFHQGQKIFPDTTCVIPSSSLLPTS